MKRTFTKEEHQTLMSTLLGRYYLQVVTFYTRPARARAVVESWIRDDYRR